MGNKTTVEKVQQFDKDLGSSMEKEKMETQFSPEFVEFLRFSGNNIDGSS